MGKKNEVCVTVQQIPPFEGKIGVPVAVEKNQLPDMEVQWVHETVENR